jgi:hypothetical protein
MKVSIRGDSFLNRADYKTAIDISFLEVKVIERDMRTIVISYAQPVDSKAK